MKAHAPTGKKFTVFSALTYIPQFKLVRLWDSHGKMISTIFFTLRVTYCQLTTNLTNLTGPGVGVDAVIERDENPEMCVVGLNFGSVPEKQTD